MRRAAREVRRARRDSAGATQVGGAGEAEEAKSRDDDTEAISADNESAQRRGEVDEEIEVFGDSMLRLDVCSVAVMMRASVCKCTRWETEWSRDGEAEDQSKAIGNRICTSSVDKRCA
jgi:hypothetical protein